MGAGKTAIGRRLASALERPFIDADRELEQRTGATVNLIFELEGEPGFRSREHELLNELTQRREIVLATGGGAVLNPVTRQFLSQRGLVVYLPADVDLQLKRLAKDRQRPLLRHPDRAQRLREMAQLRNPLYESIADVTVPAADIRVESMARQVLQAILDHHQHSHTTNSNETSRSRIG